MKPAPPVTNTFLYDVCGSTTLTFCHDGAEVEEEEEEEEATVSESLPLSVNVGVDGGICNPIKFFDVVGENVMVGKLVCDLFVMN